MLYEDKAEKNQNLRLVLGYQVEKEKVHFGNT